MIFFSIIFLLISEIIILEDQLLHLCKNLCSCHYSHLIPETKEKHISRMILYCRSLISIVIRIFFYLHNIFGITITETWFMSITDIYLFLSDGYDM